MKKNFDKLIRIALLAPFVAAMVIHGSTKPAPVVGTITYLRTEADVQYIYDAGSFVSNDLVHVAFTFAVAPGTADFQLWAWPRSSTNEEEMVLVYSNTLAGVAQPYEFEYAGAISNRWFGFTTWTPGPSVHTNGVALVNWQLPYDPAATNISAMTRTGVYIDDVRLAPNVIPLPYDAELEYLESTRTQWIDTAAQLADKVQMGVWVNTTGGDMKIWGNSYYLGGWADISWLQSVYRGTQIPQVAQTWDTITIEKSPKRLTIGRGGETFSASSWWAAVPKGGGNTANGTAVPLFGHTNEYGSWYGDNRVATWANSSYHLRISFFKAWSNGVLIRDLIPVRKGQVGYLFDRVSGALFGNAGTGAFIIGPDK